MVQPALLAQQQRTDVQQSTKEVLAQEDVYLEDDFADNEQVKASGARFDIIKKQWYVPTGRDTVPFKKWIPHDQKQAMAAAATSEQIQITQEDIYISCHYNDKEEAKALGAKWDPEKKKWYIPKGEQLVKFNKWYGPSAAAAIMEKIYIYCPITEKDQVKRLGAKWDPCKRLWYAPPGDDKTKFTQWRNPRYLQSSNVFSTLFPDPNAYDNYDS